MRNQSPKPKFRLGFLIVLAVIAVLCAPATTCPTIRAQEAEQEAQQDQSGPAGQNPTEPPQTDTTEDLLKQLDAPQFKAREAATEQLIKLGPSILKPLIVHFFESSSEAGWRIHRVLEGIGKNSSEEDFLKSIAIIQVLYGGQDDQSQRRLAKLQYQWKLTRRTEAARKLSDKGFKFASPSGQLAGQERAIEAIRMEMMMRDPGGGGLRIATGPGPVLPIEEKAPVTQWKDPRADRQQSIIRIEKIIAGDAESNRQIVESLLPPSLKVSLPPGVLEFPENWEPDEDSIKLVSELSALSNLTFRNQKLDAELCDYLSQQQNLQGLQLIDCLYGDDSEKCELKLPKKISNLAFEGSMPPVESLSSLGVIGRLQLARVELSDEYATAISRCKVQNVALDEVKFDRKSIRRLLNMRGLFQVKMSLCDFELEWFEDIRKRNENLIMASPKAFLGVQGPIAITGPGGLTGCQISQVVPNTAAAKSGMRSLDIVTAMDGIKIQRFEDLRLLISQKRPGETMKLEVKRGTKKIDLEVKLGEMDDSIR